MFRYNTDENPYFKAFDEDDEDETYLFLLEATMIRSDPNPPKHAEAYYVIELLRRGLAAGLAPILEADLAQNAELNRKKAA